MEDYKKPLFIALLVAITISMLGAAMGWFEVGNIIVKDIAESELSKKQNVAIGLSAVSLAIGILAAKYSKHRLMFVASLISVYQLVMVINQKPNDIIAKQVELSVGLGYWLSIIGSLGLVVIAVIIGAKGFSLQASYKVEK